MCKELEKELAWGDYLATRLVEHLLRMGAASSLTIPVEHQGSTYSVSVSMENRPWEPAHLCYPEGHPLHRWICDCGCGRCYTQGDIIVMGGLQPDTPPCTCNKRGVPLEKSQQPC